jgi:membrane protease YdiL (CAAX protease family)
MFGEIPQDSKPGLLKRIIQFPVTRIILGTLFVLIPLVTVNQLFKHLLAEEGKLAPPLSILMFVLMTILSVLSYYAYVHWIEKRRLMELARTGALKELGIGCTIGFSLMATIMIILWVSGYYQVVAVNSIVLLLVPLFKTIFVGFFEEIWFRGVIFRIIDETLGSWLAIIISALIFGFLHLGNPNASFYSGLAIALEAGILLAAIYLYTRRLWMVIGVHFTWNFTLGSIFGVTVSGVETEGLLKSELTGPEIITGGAFGVESSIIALIVCLIAGAYFIHQSLKQGNITKPFWRRLKKNVAEI